MLSGVAGHHHHMRRAGMGKMLLLLLLRRRLVGMELRWKRELPLRWPFL